MDGIPDEYFQTAAPKACHGKEGLKCMSHPGHVTNLQPLQQDTTSVELEHTESSSSSPCVSV